MSPFLANFIFRTAMSGPFLVCVDFMFGSDISRLESDGIGGLFVSMLAVNVAITFIEKVVLDLSVHQEQGRLFAHQLFALEMQEDSKEEENKNN